MKPSDTDSVHSYLSPPPTFPIALVVATAIAAGGLYLILQKAAPIVARPAATQTAPLKAASPPSATVPSGRPAARVDASPGPSVYRCKVDGATTYSDAPCPGGKRIDASPAAQGFAPIPVRRAPAVAQSAVEVQPVSATNEKASRDARCVRTEAEIARIDALARQGQTASMQDWLRQERQKLMDERYALKC